MAVDQSDLYIKNGGTTDLTEKQSVDCELVTVENAEEFGVFGRK